MKGNLAQSWQAKIPMISLLKALLLLSVTMIPPLPPPPAEP